MERRDCQVVVLIFGEDMPYVWGRGVVRVRWMQGRSASSITRRVRRREEGGARDGRCSEGTSGSQQAEPGVHVGM